MKPADLVGRDERQIVLAEELERLGYFYERRRGDLRATYPTVAERVAALGEDWARKVITLPVAAQACAAFYVQIPVIAKKNVTYLFLEASERGRYNDVFNSMTGEKLILASWLYEEVRRRRHEIVAYAAQLGKRLEWLPQADHFMLALTYRLHFDAERVGDPDYIREFMTMAEEHLEEWYVDLLTGIDDLVNAKRDRDPTYNAPTFFKSESGYTELVAALAPR